MVRGDREDVATNLLGQLQPAGLMVPNREGEAWEIVAMRTFASTPCRKNAQRSPSPTRLVWPSGACPHRVITPRRHIMPVGGLYVPGETWGIHQRRARHPLTHRRAELGQAGKVLGQPGGNAHELLGSLGDQLRQTEVAQLANAGPAHHGLARQVTTGTPIQKASKLVVWPL